MQLGAWQNGLIIDYNGKTRAVGKSELHHNLFPTATVLLKGELYVDSDKVVNVSQIETYHPVIWGGATVKLHYAKAEDLREYLNLTAIRGEVVVQFWLKPGDETVELNLGGGSRNEAMPGILSGL